MSQTFCPHCGRIIEPDQEPAIKAETLAEYCQEHKLPVFPGGRVSEKTAAKLLGKAVGTLRNWRYQNQPLPPIRTGNGRGRISYKLDDISNFMRLGA